MIIIIGPSASGKSTIEKELVKVGLPNIISYTSRPIRYGEVQDKDYHFISEEEFLSRFESGFFAEHTIYNGWHYGIAVEDCDENAIAVVERVGYSQLKRKFGNKVFSIYIDCPERIRLIRMINRGDNLMECFRRIFSDQGNFAGVAEESDAIVDNNRPIEETISEVFLILRNKK